MLHETARHPTANPQVMMRGWNVTQVAAVAAKMTR
ncbi:uncharacterized protein G2W53_033253 [Senna tora]|uniref:Uncharacterized protein n=1 Tax=Senna tora TaxID=362788 RepID=A0A834SZS6_9FABA|nr:uncharacterized protein G2W53_033253 [Senna tora]